MTQVTVGDAPTGRVPSPYTERFVAHLTAGVKKRLTQQAALEGVVPAHLADRILEAGLMTFDEIADATRRQASSERSNDNGSH